MRVRNTTLCYLQRGDCLLMMHRDKKENDENAGKWIGVGGKFEEGESPEDCVRREVFEETGLRLRGARLRGIVTFVSDEWGTEYMFLFTSRDFSGETLSVCDEGELEWVQRERVPRLPLWEGDRLFLSLIADEETPFFSLKLLYRGEELAGAALDGKELERGRGLWRF